VTPERDRAGSNGTLTAVAGVQVGHASTPDGASGCTVVLGPFRGAVEVGGLATGTRELGVLTPGHLVPHVDAVLLTGGSAYGLAAADGVMAWLAGRGRGYRTGVAPVPIVPGAVVFDLAEGADRPGPAEGRAACEAASGQPVGTGRVGAGTGATVGKLAGPASASPGGVGSAAAASGAWTVGALAVVNALGNVLDGAGRIVAGVRDGEGGFRAASPLVARGGGPPPLAGVNTTLGVVATDAPLDAPGLLRLARMAATALARRVDPVHTPFDGDVVFALSTAGEPRDVDAASTLALGVAARGALEEAITDAV
jgi:L-aminopeptidase/D-esterase-like protein